MSSKNIFLSKINQLSKHHYDNSPEYKKIIDKVYFKKLSANKIEDVPYLPVNIFKDLEIKSIPQEQVFKVMNSSGTSNSNPSKIFLDKKNAQIQTITLSKLVSKILGPKRLPMIILDEKEIIRNPKKYNAKTAAYLGFSIFGNNILYMNKNNKIDYENLNLFLEKFSDDPFLVFGFTYNVYSSLIEKLNIKNLSKKNLSKAILIHGGGWKKMEDRKISNNKFKEILYKKFKLNSIYNYYGLIEQTGSIFLESKKCGYFTTTEFSEIVIRDKNFKILSDGKKGFVQILSLLPTSYPGHSILTEDIGEIVSLKNCSCGSLNKHFRIYGRAKESEIRGCSDV